MSIINNKLLYYTIFTLCLLSLKPMDIAKIFDGNEDYSHRAFGSWVTDDNINEPTDVDSDGDVNIDIELSSSSKILTMIQDSPRILKKAWEEKNDNLFAYGYVLLKTGNAEDAVSPLSEYYYSNATLAPYAALLLGEAYLQTSQNELSRQSFLEAIKTLRSGDPYIQARYGLAKILYKEGKYQEAISALNSLIAISSKNILQNEMRMLLAKAFEANAQKSDAISTYEWLWAWKPTTHESEEAEQEITRLRAIYYPHYQGPNFAVRYRRALSLLNSGHVESGLDILNKLSKETESKPFLPKSFSFTLAKANFQAKQYPVAKDLFDELITSNPNEEKAELMFWRALTRGRMSQFEEAIQIYQQLASLYPKTGYAQTALMKIAMLRLDQGDYANAENVFYSYYQKYPKSTNASTALWYVAWSQLRQGHFSDALSVYDLLEQKFPATTLLPGIYYWRARIAHSLNNTDLAIKWYKKTLQFATPSHYPLFAEIHLKDLSVDITKDIDDRDLKEPAMATLPQQELLSRIESLLSLGLRTWAQDELQIYRKNLKQTSDYIALARWYRKTGNYADARLIAANIGMDSKIPKISDKSYLWNLNYPRAFENRFKQINLPQFISWELVYSVMRQETNFKPWVTSKVGARGLMQVIPETAEEVCTNRNLPPPLLHTLYKPEVSVQYGIWHLEDLMKQLDNRLPLVIAAYNAGPEAVFRWMKEDPIDPIDAFIEEISYSETRKYVKNVLTNLWIYSRLYSNGETDFNQEPSKQKEGLAKSIIAPSFQESVAKHIINDESEETTSTNDIEQPYNDGIMF